MDINDWRGISTVFLMICFIATWIWLWSSKRKKGFDEAANLPFADEVEQPAAATDKDARSSNAE